MTQPEAVELERNIKRTYVFLALVDLSLWMPIRAVTAGRASPVEDPVG